MIEVGKCYKVESRFKTEYFKVIICKQETYFCRTFTQIGSNSCEASKSVVLRSNAYDKLIEIPESEYKAKLNEVKQILEEME